MSEDMEQMQEGIKQAKIAEIQKQIDELDQRLIAGPAPAEAEEIAKKTLRLLTELGILRGEKISAFRSGFVDDAYSKTISSDKK